MSTRPVKILAFLALAGLVAVAAVMLSHPCSWAPNPPAPQTEPAAAGSSGDAVDESGHPLDGTAG